MTKGYQEGASEETGNILFLDLDGGYENVCLIIMSSSYPFILVLCTCFILKHKVGLFVWLFVF